LISIHPFVVSALFIIMSRRVLRAAGSYFKNPLVEGKYPVIPPPPTPPHIVKPPYIDNPNP
jgi:hypothetical protein